jgi:hypothetical protein
VFRDSLVKEFEVDKIKWLLVFGVLTTTPRSSRGEETGVPKSGGATGTAAPSTPASTGEPAPAPKAKEEPPVPPRKYLDAGAQLFNSGHYTLAWKYLEAAHRYRGRLNTHERVVLDLYREKLEDHLRDDLLPTPVVQRADAKPDPKAGTVDANVVAASSVGGRDMRLGQSLAPSAFTASNSSQPSAGAPAAARDMNGLRPPRGTQTWRDPGDVKQHGRWLLQQARELIIRKQFDAAAEKVAEARTLPVKWSIFDETPDNVEQALIKARGKAGTKEQGLGDGPRDRRTARTKLREARAALASHDLNKAETIARDVNSWNLRYGLFDETPAQLLEEIADARQREATIKMEQMVHSYLGGRSATPDPRVTEPTRESSNTDGNLVPPSNSDPKE